MDDIRKEVIIKKLKQFPITPYGCPVEIYEGTYLPAFGLMGSSFGDKLKALEEKWEARPDDVWVVSYPKCGHAWSFDFLSMIMKNSTELEKSGKISAFIEVSDQVFNTLNERKGPRLIMSHIPPKFLPNKIKKTSKIICIFRSPYDLAISFYYHSKDVNILKVIGKDDIKELGRKYVLDIELEPFINSYCDGRISYGRYDDFVNQSMEMIKNYDCHYFTFEEMKQNGLEELKKITKYLNLQRTDEFLQTVQEKTSFKSIKNFARERFMKDTEKYFGKTSDKIGTLVRKGAVGEGKKELTEEQIKMIREKIWKNIKSEEIRNRYK
ncbi:hypothetical protein SNEBB_006418 [Seison nebaliae]|nr:hypothetical protein SNEBB_006418 [Seison nebaliae]